MNRARSAGCEATPERLRACAQRVEHDAEVASGRARTPHLRAHLAEDPPEGEGRFELPGRGDGARSHGWKGMDLRQEAVARHGHHAAFVTAMPEAQHHVDRGQARAEDEDVAILLREVEGAGGPRVPNVTDGVVAVRGQSSQGVRGEVAESEDHTVGTEGRSTGEEQLDAIVGGHEIHDLVLEMVETNLGASCGARLGEDALDVAAIELALDEARLAESRVALPQPGHEMPGVVGPGREATGGHVQQMDRERCRIGGAPAQRRARLHQHDLQWTVGPPQQLGCEQGSAGAASKDGDAFGRHDTSSRAPSGEPAAEKRRRPTTRPRRCGPVVASRRAARPLSGGGPRTALSWSRPGPGGPRRPPARA
jgi:hypothetical protein